MTRTEYKVVKLKVDGMNSFVPMRRKSILGFGRWKIDPDWAAEEKRLAEEKFLGMEGDSTLTHVRGFINKRQPDQTNKFYTK